MSKVLKGVEGAMRGYRPQVDWGGEEGPATIKVGGHNVKVGTAGWRRRCLFILLFVLLFLSVINFVLTLWLLRNISFNVDGAGSLKVVSGGMKLDGTIKLDHGFSASEIRGQPSKVLNITGYHNISLEGIANNELLEYGINLDVLGVTAATKGIRLMDRDGSFLFDSKDGSTSTGAKFFTVTGDEGAVFYGSLESPRIQGDDVHEFRIESRTRSINGSSGNLLRIEARDGDVTATSFKDVTLTSRKGKFRFESSCLFAPHLPLMGERFFEAPTTTQRTDTQIVPPDLLSSRGEISVQALSSLTLPSEEPQNKQSQEPVQNFQLCVCPSGKLFLTSAESVCIPDEVTC